jgi:hypothetical protein
MIKEYREVLCPKSVKFMEDMLWDWVNIQERSVRIWNDDPLWWYNERASAGALAGAIWRAGGVAIEEYITQKRSRRKVGRAGGRCDLEFMLGGKHCLVEAKQCWPWLTLRSGRKDIQTPKRNIGAAMRLAKKDVRRLKKETDYKHLAVVFASPQISASEGTQWSTNLDREILGWIEQTRKQFPDCAYACTFPKSGDNIIWAERRRCYPGASIFIKLVSRG